MNVKVFQTNANGKIEFSRNELEKLLNEVYNDGYSAGEKHMRETYWTWSPSILTGGTITSTQSLPITYANESSTTAIDNLKAINADKTTTNGVAECAKTIEAKPNTWETVTASAASAVASANELDSIINQLLTGAKRGEIFTSNRPDVFSALDKELKNL